MTLDLETRFRHLYIPGRSGYGKSNLMAQFALDDIDEGFGCTVIDPKGDTVDRILEWIPAHRRDDVYYISGATAVPIDVMYYQNPEERSQIAQQIYKIFEHFTKDIGERMGPVLKFTINAVMHMEHRSFLDIYHFLQKDDGEETFDLAMKQSPYVIQNFWHVRYKNFYFQNAEVPLTTRMADFILVPILEQLLDNRNAPIKIPEVIERNQILLINLLSLGDDAARIVGSMVTDQIKHAIFRRQPLSDDDRVPYFFYADEFQDFKNITFNKFLQQARGFHLGMTLANQHPKQDGVTDLWDDIKGCVTGGYFIFQMDETHAAFLKSQIRPYKPEQLINMPQGTCLYKPMIGEARFEDIPLLPKYNPESQAGYIRNRMHQLIKKHPQTSRQKPPSDAELGDNDRPSPSRPPRSNSQPPASKRPFSSPRNPK